MDVLRFILGGRTAFFKKPEVNTYYSFTFGNIHKVALLGIFGAILGYKGYAQTDYKNEVYPEFYDKLKNIQYSVIPIGQDGFIKKKIQQFNNSVGYASKELGGNLIIKEQWLENPKWDIFILLDSEIAIKLANEIMNRRCIYVPYLGKNDHPADINNASIVKDCKIVSEYVKIDSLFSKKLAIYGDINDFENEYENVKLFKYEESLPVGLDESTQMYYYDTFVNTNLPIEKYHGEVYQIGKKNIVFN